MLGTDDILDDAHWVNVQDPIKQMFLSITKALRVQASSIRDLDRKCNDLATKDQVQHQLHVLQDTVCSKQDATQIIYQLENKIGEKEFATLQAKHLQAVDTISRLQDQLENQAVTIQTLQLKIDHLETETEKLKQPNYDQLFAYMDRRITHISSDFERKISLKIDKLEVESVIPQKLEDLYRNINGKYHELKLEMQRTATKEEVLMLAQNKADRQEVRDLLASDRETRLSKADIVSLINSQNKSLISTITALEKSSSLFTQRLELLFQDTKEKTRNYPAQLETLKHEITTVLKDDMLHSKNRHFTEAVSQIIFDTLTHPQQSSLGLITKEKCETIMHEKVEFCLQQISIFQEQLRLEMSTFLHQDLLQMQGKINDNLGKSEEQMKELIEEKIKKLKGILKEFSQNVAKSLSKKVDIRDFKHQLLSSQKDRLATKELVVLESDHKSSGNSSGREFDELIKSLRSSTTNKGDTEEDDDAEDYESSSYEESKQQSSSSHGRPHINNNRSMASATGTRRSHLRTSPSKSKRHSSTTTTTLQHVHHTDMSTIQAEITQLRQSLHSLQQQQQSSQHYHTKASYDSTLEQKQQLEFLDWRIALGELSTFLRTELAFKISKPELHSFLSEQNSDWQTRVLRIEEMIKNTKKEKEEKDVFGEKMKKVEMELKSLGQKVMGELIGARFLWTNGQSSSQSFLLWDTQVINAAPSSILWRQGGREVTVRVPGLYKITVAVFAPVVDTSEDSNSTSRGEPSSNRSNIVQVYLNDEPILSYQPLSSPSSTTYLTKQSGSSTVDSQVYYLKRFHHTMGEVTSMLIDEFVSLPPESRLSVRYFANEPAQAFMAIRKM